MSGHGQSMKLLFDTLTPGEQVRFVGSQLRLMSSSVCVAALGYLSSSQLKDVRAMLNARSAAETEDLRDG